jgi:hypothetical protein
VIALANVKTSVFHDFRGTDFWNLQAFDFIAEKNRSKTYPCGTRPLDAEHVVNRIELNRCRGKSRDGMA